MPESHWISDLVKSKSVRIIAFILTALITICVLVGLFTNKHVNLWVVEFNGRDTVKQVIYIKSDTLLTAQKNIENHTPVNGFVNKRPVANKKLLEIGIKQVNKSGDNTVNQNSGTNNGNIGENNTLAKNVINGVNNGINGDVYTEKELSYKLEMEFISLINQNAHKVKKERASVNLTPESNGHKVAARINQVLQNLGYKTHSIGIMMPGTPEPYMGIKLSIRDSCFVVNIGIIE